MDIAAWLRGLGLERYEEAFRENEIDAEILPKLTADDLKDIGVTTVGHRRKLLEAIAALAEPALAPQEERGAPAEAAPKARAAEAERRQLTVLFCDLVGSTELSARLDPEDMGQLIRSYQDSCTEVVERWGGHVAKYMGDGVLAYFGWPQAHEDEAERAVRAGLALTEAVGKLAMPPCESLAARVGIATGLVMVGELVGEGGAREEAVVGETPNLAARLQALAGPGAVVISQATRRLVGGLFELADLGPQRLKGFAEPLAAFRVVGEGRAEGRFEALHGERLTPLVGREHELGILLERWHWAKDGEGQIVLLSGEPGIGKSRLTRSLIERLADEPHTRLRHYCSPYHTNSALFPVIDQMERAAGFQAEDTVDTRLDKLEAVLAQATDGVAAVAPLIASLLSIPTDGRYPPVNLTPEAQKLRTFEALLGQMEGLAGQRPVLMVLEDAHWIDPTSVELFGLVIDRIQRLPVLLLITFRPDFTPPWTGYARPTPLTLSRLGQRQGAQMVERLTGDKPLPPEVLEQILLKTDGVPLFVEELTKTVLESGLLADTGDHYELAGPLPPLAIPTTLHDSLMARLDRLAPVKEVAQIGAVIGREFSHELLAAVSPLPEDKLAEALGQLVASELVFRRGVPPEATYSFKHALVQDAAYQSLLKSKRQRVHARIAEILEQRFPDTVETEPELLAYHYAEAGLAQPAVDHWLRAGKRAVRRSAHLEAIAHLEKGLAFLEALPDPANRLRREIDLQIARGMALLPLKGQAAPEVGEAYARARELCERTGETSKLYSVLQGLWHFHVVRAELGRARELAERCYIMAQRDEDPTLLLAADFVLCGSLAWVGEFDASRGHLDHALQIEDRTQHQTQGLKALLLGVDLHAFLRSFGCHTVWHLGYADQAVRLSEEAVARARQADEPFSLALALDYAAMLRQFGRDYRGTSELALAAIELCSEHHFAYYLAWATILHGWALAAAGYVDDGIARMQRGLTDLEATGARLRRPYYLTLLAEAHIHAGRPEEGLKIVADAITLAETTGERWRDADLHRTRGGLLLALSRERAAEAEACFRDALEIAREQNAKALQLQTAIDLARLWRDQGKRAQAHDLLAPVYAWFTEGFDTADLKDAKALLDELR